MSRLLRALFTLLACALCACSPEAKQATQVLLELDAEPEVRARLAKLSIEIRGGAADAPYSAFTGEPASELDAPSLPLQIALVPRDGDASRRYLVSVRAYAKDGSPLAEARVVSGYAAHSVRFARLILEDACIGVSQCGGSDEAPLTCRGGACADPSADVRDFSVQRDRPSLIQPEAESDDAGNGQTEGGGARDGGSSSDGGGGRTDAGDFDGGTRDGGGSADSGSAQANCKLGSSKLPCRLGM